MRINRVEPYLKNWTEILEKQWLEEFGGIKAWAVGQGREALFYILKALPREFGNKVYIQSHTCQSVFDTIEKAGFKIIHDIDNSDYKIAIITHLFGIPNVELDYLTDINKFIIEDCAQCVGAKYRNKFVGSFGDASFYSFGFDKPISANGGGMLVLNELKLLQAVDWLIETKLSQINSLIALEQMKEYNEIQAIRNQNAEYYQNYLSSQKYELPFISKDCEPSFIRFPIIAKKQPAIKIAEICQGKGFDIRSWGANRPENLLCLPVHQFADLKTITDFLNDL